MPVFKINDYNVYASSFGYMYKLISHLRFNVILNKENQRVFLFLLLGFVSGIPFLLVLSTLTIWLTELGFSKTVIGVTILCTIPYSLKPLWAIFIDNISFNIFRNNLHGKYAWGVLANIALAISIIGLGVSNPQANLELTILFAFLVSFCAATQDIVVDSLRIELIPGNLVGIGAAMESIGFRSGMLGSGAGALYLAEYISWVSSYIIMGVIVLFGSLVFFLLYSLSVERTQDLIETNYHIKTDRNLFHSLYEVVREPYFISLVSLIFFFKLADAALNAMTAPFIYELGFNKIEFADISKVFGTIMMICGSITGGYFVTKFSTVYTMKLYGLLQIIAACMFIIQTIIGYNYLCLIFTIALESFVSGIGSVALLAYLVKFCRTHLTATHFTIFYSCSSLFRVLISFLAGICADQYGWYVLFTIVALLSCPFFFLLNRVENLTNPLIKQQSH